MSSQLAVVGNDSLKELALELGLDLEALEKQSAATSSSGATWTNFTRVEDARIVNGPKWLDGGIFKWCEPGQPDYVEDVDEMPEIQRLGGIIVHAELQGSLQEKSEDGAERASRVCSVAGYRNPSTGTYIKALPDYYTLGSMYGGWNKEANTPDRFTPNPVVADLDLVGSRGMRCVDCIKGGQSFLTDDSGKVTGECSMYGRLYFYVTEVSKIKLIPPKKGSDEAPEEKVTTKSISDLYPGETGVLVIMNLPAVTGLRGKWNKDEKISIRGFVNYVRQLQMDFTGLRRIPSFNFTTIDIKPPIAGAKSTKNLLHFGYEESFDISLIRDAKRAWEAARPKDDVPELDISKFGTIATNEMRSADAPIHVESSVVNNDDVPF